MSGFLLFEPLTTNGSNSTILVPSKGVIAMKEKKINQFELNGRKYSLVEPKTFDELVHALSIEDYLQEAIDQNMPDDADEYMELQHFQELYIKNYIDQIGDFDNSVLIKNIAYLLKRSGLKMGQLEKILGISTGYISRTARENSGKRMSIDVVWKIAKLFQVDLRLLVETSLESQNTNVEIATKFILKLTRDTETSKLVWDREGGLETVLMDRISSLGLFEDDDEGQTIYHPDHLNPECVFLLAGDIFSIRLPNNSKRLVIIPYCWKNHERSDDELYPESYDYILVWSDEGSNSAYHWEKFLYPNDAPLNHLDEYSAVLYEKIQNQEFDVHLSADVKKMMFGYLSEEE